MKKLLVSLAVALIFIAPVAAVEYGGVLKNDTKAVTPQFKDYSFKQSNGLYLWLKTPFGKSAWSFSAEAMYKFSLDIANGMVSASDVADVDLFKINANYSLGTGNLNIALGRFLAADNTSVSFAQNCDGLFIKYSLPVVQVSAYAGYTGLLNVHNVSMLDGEGSFIIPKNKVYALASPYIPVYASLNFPALFANQALGFQAEAVLDMTPQKLNRYYANILMSGYMTNSVYYSLVTEVASVNFKNISNYSSFDLVCLVSGSFNFNTGVKYASGKNGFLDSFHGFTSNTAYGAANAPEMSGVIVPYAGFIIKASPTVTTVTVKTPFNCEEGIAFSGVDLDLNFSAKVMSDFQLGFVIHGFLDIAEKGKNAVYSASLNAAIAF